MEALFIYSALDDGLTEAELTDHFSLDEQEVIYRYQEQTMRKVIETFLENDKKMIALKKMKKAIEKHIQYSLENLDQDFDTYRRDVLGWPELDQRQLEASQAFRKALEYYGSKKSDYLALIQKYGKPSPTLLAKIENRVGPLDLD